MTYSYDLLTAPWIPCLDHAGRAVCLGLRDVVLRAHDMRGIRGETPLVTAATYRLLLALLHRVYGPPDMEAWEAMWAAGRWPPAPLDHYLQRWQGRFDLFHPEYPFLQQRDQRVSLRSVTVLLPTADARDTLFEHHLDEDRLRVSPARAATLLLATRLYDLSGACHPQQKLYFSDGPLGRSIAFALQGTTLFYTLMLNLAAYPDDTLEPLPGDDRPAWECDDPLRPVRTQPLGRLDALTWPSRRIWLRPEGPTSAPEVELVTISPGLPLDDTYRDPMKHYYVQEESGHVPLGWREERALWRDSASLLQLNPVSVRPVLALEWAAALAREHRLQPGVYSLSAFGMLTEPGRDKTHTYLAASLPIASDYVANSDYVDILSEAVQLAELTASVLQRAARDLASQIIWPDQSREQISILLGKKANKDRVKRLTSEWAVGRGYWPQLELSFMRLLEGLPGNPDLCRGEWLAVLRERAYAAFDRVSRPLQIAPRNLKAAVRARAQLDQELSRVLGKPGQGSAGLVSEESQVGKEAE